MIDTQSWGAYASRVWPSASRRMFLHAAHAIRERWSSSFSLFPRSASTSGYGDRPARGSFLLPFSLPKKAILPNKPNLKILNCLQINKKHKTLRQNDPQNKPISGQYQAESNQKICGTPRAPRLSTLNLQRCSMLDATRLPSTPSTLRSIIHPANFPSFPYHI